MTKANLFVLMQFVLILLIFLQDGMLADQPWIIMQFIAILIGLWAILQFDFKELAISPVPKNNAKLVTSGPYHWIRNPMYLAVLLYCLALTIKNSTVLSYFLWISLFTLLHEKLRFEERLLKKRYPEYKGYCKRSKKLIPFIY